MDVVIGAIDFIITILGVWLLIMLIYQLFLSFFGYKRNTKDYSDHDPEMRFLVLIPAHNEESVISGIIDNLQHMDYPRELYDFYVLADNCSDKTAAVARSMGVKVLETYPESADAPTGKPIVLQRALKTLEGYHEKYDLVAFFDADNLIDTNFFREINSQYLSCNKNAVVIQSYLGCKNKQGMVAYFYYMGYTITNRFVQYAKNRLKLNTGIGGTGFVVSADYLNSRGGWTSMSLTEDFELQIEATCEGHRVLWNQNVGIYDEKPTQVKPSYRQRVRWAQGQWFVAFRNTPKLIKALFKRRISVWEFVSTLLCMYSMSAYVILLLQFLLNGVLQVFTWLGLAQSSRLPVTVSSIINGNLSGIALFIYSFIVLFYVGDYLDNHRKPTFKGFFPLLWSFLINTAIAGWAQVEGLFRHRQQHTWVKTEHKISHADSEILRRDVSNAHDIPMDSECVGEKSLAAHSSR